MAVTESKTQRALRSRLRRIIIAFIVIRPYFGGVQI
jgi:hypothetical protein